MTLERRAGMIPYYVNPNGRIEFLLMVPINPKLSARPQIAKGGIDDNEDYFKAARREAKEELGLRKKNMKRTPLHLGLWDTTEIFIVEVIDKENFKPIDTKEVKKTVWMTIEEFREAGRKSQRAVLELAFIIAKRINEIEQQLHDTSNAN